MASKIKKLSGDNKNGKLDGANYSFAIVVSEYHDHITHPLRDGAVDVFLKHGVKKENIIIDYVPGAFELPMGATIMAQNYDLDGVVCIGCVIKGDTDHDKYINQSVAIELQRISSDMLVPMQFGLLTTNDEQQALDRAGGKHGNKGAECALAALKMAAFHERNMNEDFDEKVLFN